MSRVLSKPVPHVPQELSLVSEAIDRSKWMLGLEEDWDGEGSPAYAPVTWQRATRFLLDNAVSLLQDAGVVVQAPAIHNGPLGSIDIYWDTPRGRLLINVPPDSTGAPSFYGCSVEGCEIKGTLSLDADNRWLLLWQMERK